MKTIDPGHRYNLLVLDGDDPQILQFVKRFDPHHPERYPGNFNAHQGTTLQSVIRCLIERVEYLQGQIPCVENECIHDMLGDCLMLLENRAARRHGMAPPDLETAIHGPMCPICGHVKCHHNPVDSALKS